MFIYLFSYASAILCLILTKISGTVRIMPGKVLNYSRRFGSNLF